MKRAIVLILLALPLLSCGNGSGSSSTAGGTINTTLVSAINQTGIQQATPANMAGINDTETLTIDSGSNLEQVTVTAITATTFTANFLRAHPAGVSVTGAAVVSTSLQTAITGTGSQTATPVSTAGMLVGQTLAIDTGNAFEEVVVTAVTGTTFTASFTKTHPAGVQVTTNLVNPGNSSSTRPSNIKFRAFVTNSFNNLGGSLQILNDQTDQYLGNQISLATGAGLMVLSPDKQLSLVFESSGNSVSIINNSTEAAAGSISLPGLTDSIVFGSGVTFAYAAVRNAPVSGASPGQIEVLSTADIDISGVVNVPLVRTLVASHNGAKLLAFPDQSAQSHTAYVVDTASLAVTPITGLDSPVFGVFSSDDNTAYILNCGPECGGTQASVVPLTMSNSALAAPTPVSAATYALLDGSNLYVAGTVGPGNGRLDVVNTGNMTVSKSGVPITDGYHNVMVLNTNGKLWVGSRTCTPTTSCLTIFDTTAQTASIVPIACSSFSVDIQCKGDVSGVQPIANRPVVYVVEGGALIIVDSTTGAAQLTQVDIVGHAVGIAAPDQK